MPSVRDSLLATRARLNTALTQIDNQKRMIGALTREKADLALERDAALREVDEIQAESRRLRAVVGTMTERVAVASAALADTAAREREAVKNVAAKTAVSERLAFDCSQLRIQAGGLQRRLDDAEEKLAESRAMHTNTITEKKALAVTVTADAAEIRSLRDALAAAHNAKKTGGAG